MELELSDKPISVQLYSVRHEVADDLTATLERLARIGFLLVEPYDFVERYVEYERALLATGLSAPSAHAPVLQYRDPRPAFEAAASIGVRTLIDPHRPEEYWHTTEDIAHTAELMNEAAAVATQFDMSVGYHNHWYEVESMIDDQTALEHFVSYLSPEVVLEIDTFWVEVGGKSAPDVLLALGERVQFIHVKDGPITRDPKLQLPAGHGHVDVPAVLKAAPRALRVLEFDDYAGDTFDGLATSLRFVADHDL